MGSWSAICYYKSTKPPPLQGTCNFIALIPLSYWRFFYHWLNLWMVFNWHPTMISDGYIPFFSSYTSFAMLVDNQPTDDFVHCQQSTLKSHREIKHHIHLFVLSFGWDKTCSLFSQCWLFNLLQVYDTTCLITSISSQACNLIQF